MIELGKNYKTRDGREAQVFALDNSGMYPVVGRVKTDGEWETQEWTAEGRWAQNAADGYDLIEVKPERTGWINIYPSIHNTSENYVGLLHADRESANAMAMQGRIACLKITFTDGQGL